MPRNEKVTALLERFFALPPGEERDGLVFEVPYDDATGLDAMARELLRGPAPQQSLTARFHAVVWALGYLEGGDAHRAYHAADLPRLARLQQRVAAGRTPEEARDEERSARARPLFDPPVAWKDESDPLDRDDEDGIPRLVLARKRGSPLDRLLTLLESRGTPSAVRVVYELLELRFAESAPDVRAGVDAWHDPSGVSFASKGAGVSRVVEHVRALFEDADRFERLLPLARDRVAEKRAALRALDPAYDEWFDELPEHFQSDDLDEQTVLRMLRHPERWVQEAVEYANFDFHPAVRAALAASALPRLRRLVEDA